MTAVPGLRLGPPAVLAAIAAGWALAIGAQAAGAAALLHHDALIGSDTAAPLAVALFLLAWQVMIAAMMLPSSLPLIRLFGAATSRVPQPRAAMAGLVAGYALVWSAFGALAFGFDALVHAGIDASPWLSDHDWLIGASLLALAGAFQFTPLKDACLRACRHPAMFLNRFYRRGTGEAVKLGARHGLFCVGCCWALMLIMFAAGVASLLWMALLTALMVHEKTSPAGDRTVPVTGITLLAGAALIGVAGAL
jgi:predicted metal-binding membrane protein